MRTLCEMEVGDPSARERTTVGDGTPAPVLRVGDAIALVVGIVIGAGIFRAPSVVATNAPSSVAIVAAWAIGGAVSLAGALCYAELATAYPGAGGDYGYLGRALGGHVAFLFAWARLTVIPTGSLALLAFVFGDYASELLGRRGASPVLAGAMVLGLTVLNAAGLRPARGLQRVLTTLVVSGLVLVIVAGLALRAPAQAGPPATAHPAFGLAMVFVLLAYGGWNEAAYLSGEMRQGPRAIVAALVLSMLLVTALYVLANVAYLRGLGLSGVMRSDTVAADLLARAIGAPGARAVSLVIATSAVTSANAVLFMGSRMAWAFGRDCSLFAPLGRWSARSHAPVAAVCAQGAMALALVALGAASRRGFETMVAYTAPVFWLFFFLTGVSLFVLRGRDPTRHARFRVPLYPATPAVFCAACAFLLWSSIAHAGPGAAAGIAVLATGLVPLWLSTRGAQRRLRAA